MKCLYRVHSMAHGQDVGWTNGNLNINTNMHTKIAMNVNTEVNMNGKWPLSATILHKWPSPVLFCPHWQPRGGGARLWHPFGPHVPAPKIKCTVTSTLAYNMCCSIFTCYPPLPWIICSLRYSRWYLLWQTSRSGLSCYTICIVPLLFFLFNTFLLQYVILHFLCEYQ
jgi:hypothetical protein